MSLADYEYEMGRQPSGDAANTPNGPFFWATIKLPEYDEKFARIPGTTKDLHTSEEIKNESVFMWDWFDGGWTPDATGGFESDYHVTDMVSCRVCGALVMYEHNPRFAYKHIKWHKENQR